MGMRESSFQTNPGLQVLKLSLFMGAVLKHIFRLEKDLLNFKLNFFYF